MRAKYIVLGAVAMLVCCQAFGQMMTNPSQWYINNQIYSTRVFNGVVANSMLRAKGGKAPTKVTAVAGKVTSFRQSSNSIVPKLLASKADAASRAETERFFQSHVNLYRDTARKDGFPANDLAYAFEYFVVNNYHLYHDLIGSRQGVTMAQERAVFNQFKQMLSSNPSIKKMTDKQKQEATELLAILFGVNYTGYQARSRGNGEELYQQARQLAKEGLEKLLGAKIQQIKITNKGIEI